MCEELMIPTGPNRRSEALALRGEKITAAEGIFVYCGRYEIDARQDWIVHQPEVATDPGDMESRQVRPFRFDGGRLILSDIKKNDPSVARWKIVWEKVQ